MAQNGARHPSRSFKLKVHDIVKTSTSGSEASPDRPACNGLRGWIRLVKYVSRELARARNVPLDYEATKLVQQMSAVGRTPAGAFLFLIK